MDLQCSYVDHLAIISFTVNYCRNIIKYLDNGFIIEILSFAHINSLVGVENISDGYNLSLQVRIVIIKIWMRACIMNTLWKYSDQI